MKLPNPRMSAYVAAGLLACLTIRVFFELQYYGPESAIRLFNDAIRDHDIPALQRISVDKLEGQSVRAMIAKLDSWYAQGATMHVARMERTGDEVRAAVIFSLPGGTTTGMIWVVQRKGKSWQVDANKTALILWDNLGLR